MSARTKETTHKAQCLDIDQAMGRTWDSFLLDKDGR